MHDVRFPGETAGYRQARDELLEAEMDLRRRIEAVAAQRRELPLGGAVPEDYEFEEWDERPGARGPSASPALRGRKRLFLYSFMFPPGERGLPLEVPCPLVHLDHRRGRRRCPPPRASASTSRWRRSPDPPVPRPRADARLAPRPVAVLRRQHLQPRLPRRGRRGEPAAHRHRLRPPRREGPPPVVQRADVRSARAGHAPAPRGLHVAAVAHLRPHPGGRGDWEPELEYGLAT